jgi:hypothetical protein
MQRSVWYSWTAPDDGWVYLNFSSAYFEPALAVYKGTNLSSLQRVTWLHLPDLGTPGPGLLRFVSGAGQTYQIAVDGLLGPEGQVYSGGPFELRIGFFTLEIISPTNEQIYLPGEWPQFAVNSANPSLDGELTIVTYLVYITTRAKCKWLRKPPPNRRFP